MRQRVGGIIIRGDKVLLMHRIKNGEEYYCFPGGGVDEDETPEEALKREIKEETNFDFTSFEKLCEFSSRHQYEIYYVIEDPSGEPEIIGEERERRSETNIYQLAWLPVNQLEQYTIYPEEIVKQFFDYYKNIPVN